jgi:signal transduction histidine kinase
MLFIRHTGEVMRMNHASQEFFGDPLPKVWEDIVLLTPDTHIPIPIEQRPTYTALHGHLTRGLEAVLQFADGRQVPVLVHATPVYVDGSLVATVIAFQDIAALKEADRAKDQFLAVLSHELRTPLTSVATHLEAMMMGIWEPTQERLNSCHEEILRLTSLVKDLENLTKVESDVFHLDKTEVELKELVEAVLDTFQGEMQAKHLTYQVTGEKSVVLADRDRIKQVVLNLLSNAVKYTPEGGSITVQVMDNSAESTILVSDTGIGIPDKDIDHIFERFYRTEKSRSRQTGGAGIGLTIVKSIMEAHNGTVEVFNKEGEGSTFIIRLPK